MLKRLFTSRMTVSSVGVIVVCVVSLTGTGIARSASSGPARLTAQRAHAASASVPDHVIIVFKDQVSSIPDSPADSARRSAAVAAVQAGVMGELQNAHASHVLPLQLINAVAAVVSPGEASRLAANPAVARVVPDPVIRIRDATPAVHDRAMTAATSADDSSGCPPAGQVQLNPQAVETIHAAEPPDGGPSAQGLGYTGAGVKVAVIAGELDIHNPDLTRSDGRSVVFDYHDFSGLGTNVPGYATEAFLDAGTIAAQGRKTYDLGKYGYGPKPCRIRLRGVAPGASLAALDALGPNDFSYGSVGLAAINYAVTVDRVDVINESFGADPFPDQGSLDLTRMADDAAVAAGVTVIAGSGDAGPANTIASPASDPAVISAGASTTYRAYAQGGFEPGIAPGAVGWLDDNISPLSSAGFTQSGSTVDLVAPGDENWELCSPNPHLYLGCINQFGQPSPITFNGGTSESAPLTAGVAALVIQAYRKTHGGASPTPAEVKQILVSTAQDISAPSEQQGAGRLDAYAAVQAAASYPGATTSTGHALLESTSQFHAVAAESTSKSFAETVTNAGSTPQTVSLSSRRLGAYHQVAASTVQLNNANQGLTTLQFQVAAGQARLNASIAYDGSPTYVYDGEVAFTLISPSGQMAIYSRPFPGNISNHGNAQVSNPQPGAWTAVIFNYPSPGEFLGPVRFQAGTASWVPFGTLSRSRLTLAPGTTGAFTLSVATPAQPGDQSGAVVLTSDAKQPAFELTTTVPVSLHSLIPTPNPTTTFTGALTGGNGRQFDLGQTDYYKVSIPAGLPELNASISTPDAADTFVAELIDPATGEAASTAASATPSIGGGITPQAGAQLHVLDPRPGVWTLAIDFYNQQAGTAVSQPFTVTLNRVPVPASAPLPDSPAVILAAGVPTTVNVRVTNTGPSPEAYFIDGRLKRAAHLSLAALSSSQTTVPITGTPPLYMIPSHTTAITADATASAPLYFDYWWAFGDPDLNSASQPYSDTATGTFSADPVVPGEWAITGYSSAAHTTSPFTADTSLTATTAAFDPAITASTGDLWQQASDPTSTVNPTIVAPGQTATIPVTIAPSGPAGRTVTGTLYIDAMTKVSGAATWYSLPRDVDQGGDVAALPYIYTIGAKP